MAHATVHAPSPAEAGPPSIWGVMAEYPTPAAIYHAAEEVRDAGFSRWDVYAPFPIHGIDEAMGLRGSKVAWIVGFGAFFGVVGAMTMQWWMLAIDYQIVVAAKPLFAWEQYLPVTFELGVLFSAFGAIFGMLALNKLPMWYHPLLKKERFLRVSDDRFIIAIEAADPRFDPVKTREMLTRLGATSVEMVEE
jgi:hypothetical protein